MKRSADIVLTILLALFVLACIPPALILLAAFWLGDIIERKARRRLTRGRP
ncbi:hypothetical protein SAMN05216337_1017107 [Bradyrhizobium brasilense]|uniref:Uncharacterized protein n=1 Tax=Bradyrhizobium brasilense TaxID=1419277 RepID=A0A1G6YV97_9BRAD|nr:hypothetical protein [Bradyrhizobium brasilense]SDD94258.1 hypothetical protein SAMN05216337_1017107 [Bradyrhizobium brasilense]